MDKWTPVTPENTPEDRQRVLTYCPTQYPGFRVNVHTYYAHILGKTGLPWWMGQRNYDVEGGHVTHWQPLPTGPDGKQ